MLKVHVLYEHSPDLRPHGCSYIRLLLPLTHPANAEVFSVTHGPTYLGGADVVMVERLWQPAEISIDMAAALVEQVRRDRAYLIYALDDNLLDLRPWSFVQPGLTQAQTMVVRYLAREADGLIVSTEALKERLARLNPHIAVVPNALDERLFGEALPERNIAPAPVRKVLGFMGTYSHDADLLLILEALRATLRRHPGELEFQLVGGVAEEAVLRAFESLPLRVLDTSGQAEYPAFVRWMIKNLRWDVALAPLEDTAFTRSKSDIKFLDYSALGFPGIYSRVPVYANTVRHLETGYLAENTPEAWSEALELLLTDDALRWRLASNARDYVLAQRTLRQCACQWQEATLSLVNQKLEKA